MSRPFIISCFVLALCAASEPALGATPPLPLTSDSANPAAPTPRSPGRGHHGGFWLDTPGYRSPGLAMALSLTPMPIDFGNLYAENFGWGMVYTTVELGLAVPLIWLGTRHMCGHHSEECDAWTDSERSWGVGLLGGYVGVKLLSAIHAGYAARAYNDARREERAGFLVFPLSDGAALGWMAELR